jgi:rabenosyn-5
MSRPSSGTTSPIPSLPIPKLAFHGEEQDTSEPAAPGVEALPAVLPHAVNGTVVQQPTSEHLTSPVLTKDTAATPVLSDVRSAVVKKTTFRRLPGRGNVQSSTHSRNTSITSTTQPPRNGVQMDTRSPFLSPSMSPDSPANIPLPPPKDQESKSHSALPPSQLLPVESPSIMKASSSTAVLELSHSDKPLPSIQHTSSPRRLAPYRPGFQPLGVRRHLTDDFLEIRRIKRDGEGPGDMKRVERTKLERRLEKLIILHFPEREHEEKPRPGPRPLANGNRRASIFDFGSLKNMNLTDAGGLWKGLVASNVVDSAKNDLRGCYRSFLVFEMSPLTENPQPPNSE